MRSLYISWPSLVSTQTVSSLRIQNTLISSRADRRNKEVNINLRYKSLVVLYFPIYNKFNVYDWFLMIRFMLPYW